MKKIATISIFIFLTGLFAGLFFSIGLSEENNDYLSGLLLSGLHSSSNGFIGILLSSLISNMTLAVLMLAAVVTRLLCPLPFMILIYKSFAVGFCSGLLYLNDTDNAFLISLVKMVPQNILLIPAFIALASVTFSYSSMELRKTKRPSREKKGLQNILLISLAAIAAGCIVQSLFQLITI